MLIGGNDNEDNSSTWLFFFSKSDVTDNDMELSRKLRFDDTLR